MASERDLREIADYLGTPSTIGEHRDTCCRDALAWLRCADAAHSYRDGCWLPPTWLRKRYEWGPNAWPLHWCYVPEMEKLDCGALAAVAVRVFLLRGESAVPVQLALQYPRWAAEQWARMWEREALRADWISGELCYHEACGVFRGEQMLLWDPTDSRWVDPPASPEEGFAAVKAFKVFDGSASVRASHWGGIPIQCGVWQSVIFDGQGRLTTVYS